ncbi:MAG: HAMP domain-containing sensor histidine kinase [bacterium]
MKIQAVPKKIFPFQTVESLKVRIAWFINLRWFAVIGIYISVPLSQFMFCFKLGYPQLIIIASILLLLNLIYFFIIHHAPIIYEYQELVFAELQILIDFVIISFLLHFGGGINNPFYFLYLVHIVLSGILFPGVKLPYFNAGFAALLLTFWTFAEHFGVIPRFKLEHEPISFMKIIISLIAFCFTSIAAIYIITNFLVRFRTLKVIIDQKNEQLEKVMEDRSKIFRFAAHELKSPITAIHSTINVVRDLYGKELDVNAIDMLERAEKRTDQVLEMVKEMITISKYNLEIKEVVKEKVNFGELITSQVSLYNSPAKTKSLQIELRILPVPFEIEIDKPGMEKVIGNLVSNAIRYTPHGGKITIEQFITNSDFGFSVKDTGIGISEEDLPKIFQEFYRTKEAKRMEQIGTGLGLNMVKEIVEKSGGQIIIRSKPEKGSIFIVKIPLPPEKISSYDL